jgi:hypothetical protein
MKKLLLLTLAALCLMAAPALAGEPWPENICHVLTGYEQRDIRFYGNDPANLAFARTNVLHMLRNHCGVDITAKEAADVAATSGPPAPSYSGNSGGGGGWIEPLDGPTRSKPSTHCTTMSLGGGLSATDCE